jgi:hypothetical protein
MDSPSTGITAAGTSVLADKMDAVTICASHGVTITLSSSRILAIFLRVPA